MASLWKIMSTGRRALLILAHCATIEIARRRWRGLSEQTKSHAAKPHWLSWTNGALKRLSSAVHQLAWLEAAASGVTPIENGD